LTLRVLVIADFENENSNAFKSFDHEVPDNSRSNGFKALNQTENTIICFFAYQVLESKFFGMCIATFLTGTLITGNYTVSKRQDKLR